MTPLVLDSLGEGAVPDSDAEDVDDDGMAAWDVGDDDKGNEEDDESDATIP